ncbi:YczE/YyaS/YitT family protein [Texcoconibacillus texcoconensis]|uniref:YitT family protein n=1 Tax=Texcoconibacillus texcoconensis TaxID=1095777 RepID=A0A840QR62_9BACI|nr:YitT family protein [Texcoconibacillus texcoconensis]MBB5173811.1 hypothetical protein [Texcoconibacillus texcoconensis]
MNTWILRSIVYTAGLIILSFGVSLLITADLGVGPWDALFVGLSTTIGLTAGSWIFIIGIMLIIINAFLLERKPDLPAVATIFLLGLLLDFWLLFVFSNVTLSSFSLQLFLLFSGVMLMAVGISLYLQAGFAKNPIDNLMIAFQYRTGKSLNVSKTILEFIALTAAFIFSGPIGLGTLIIAFSIGPLIQVFYPPFEKRFCFS